MKMEGSGKQYCIVKETIKINKQNTSIGTYATNKQTLK